MLVHEAIDPVPPGGLLNRPLRVQVFRIGQRTAGLGCDHTLLPEIGHFTIRIPLVEVDYVREALDGSR